MVRRDFPAKKTEPSLGLVDQTTATLRSRIIDGWYGTDGELPPQGELCEELAVSRSVVREAMQRLQSQGLIDLGQGRKPRVLPLSADGLTATLQLVMSRTDSTWVHLGEVRQTLEVDIAGRAAERATPTDVRALEKAIALMESTDDRTAQVDADLMFHRLLAQATGNPMYVFLLDALASLLRASRERTIGKGGIEPAVRGHRKILEAVRDGEPSAARAAMLEHLDESQQDLRRLK